MALSNRDVQESISGLVQKKVWSMVFARNELYMSEVVKKGYKEQSVRKAIKRLIELGAIVPVEGKRNCYKSNGVTK